VKLLQLSFSDQARAERDAADLFSKLTPSLATRMDMLLAASPAPEQGLQYLARFPAIGISEQNARFLVAIATHSQVLAEDIIEHPDWIAELRELQRALDFDEFHTRLNLALAPGLPSPIDLAIFRRRQLLRIMVRDVLGFATLAEVTAELSALADAILQTAYARIHQDLVSRFGAPAAQFSVIALGKLGGMELNYSSDIDLMFLYSSTGETAGPARVTNKEFFIRAANQLTSLLSTYTAEGVCYRVDLRLRPDGSLGEVCISLDGARQYYEKRARDWELQMLIKARVAAGDRAVGTSLLDFVEPRIYSTTTDFSAVEALSETRERINEKLAAKRRPSGQIDIKLDRGGIRDIEFVVQCLQRLHGGAERWVRHGGTLLALSRLQDKGFLSGSEYGQLASAYQFLRHLEHRLQFAEDRQTHALPTDRRELELVARRMPAGGGSAEWLLAEIQRHFEQVIEIYDRVVHSGRGPSDASPGASNLVRALDVRAPAVSAALAHAELKRGYRAFEFFLERLPADRLELLDTDPALTSAALDLFELSPYFAEEMIRTPELIDEIGRAPGEVPAPDEMTALRRWYRREMLRIQSKSITHSHPIFETLAETSELADTVIARAYDIAIRETLAAHSPADAGYTPVNQMWVIALGRLGMREFDLGSDADLVFVLADSDISEMQFWTRVAERLIDLVTAYTGEGFLFAVDTRLRPNGGGGPLVQSEGAYIEYFGRGAEAWEGITYMKSRAVAGDPARGEAFLHQLQETDWRRYGQSGRSRTDLHQMRLRLEREQGAGNPLKAGRGGYYDIDFLLMYLRLKSAGIFFKVLNTPERIEVLESMGHLDRSEAAMLNETATFYRALDHGMRLLSGHAGGKLPGAEGQLENLAALLARWTPVPLSDLQQVRSRTRALFDRLFG
jgi:glutamate-ammonia-ligase adenylyltransferase